MRINSIRFGLVNPFESIFPSLVYSVTRTRYGAQWFYSADHPEAPSGRDIVLAVPVPVRAVRLASQKAIISARSPSVADGAH